MAGGGDVRVIGGNKRVADGVANVTDRALWVRVVNPGGGSGVDPVRVWDGTDILAITAAGEALVDISAQSGPALKVDVAEIGGVGTPSYDDVHGSTDPAIPIAVLRDDSLVSGPQADGDYVPLRSDNQGRLWVRVDGDLIVMASHNIGDTVPLSPDVFPVGLIRDDVLTTLTELDGDWTLGRTTSLGELWTSATLRLQQNEIVAGAGLAVVRAERIPIQNYGLTGLPQLTFTVGGAADVFATAITDPNALQAAAVNGPMGGLGGTGGAVRTGPDRDTIVSLFAAQVFNNVTTAANSALVDVSTARWAVIYIDLAEAGTPTDIRLIAQFSNDGGTTWFDYAVDQWVDLRYVDTQMPLTEVIPLNYVIGSDFRLRAVATGTGVADTFTLSADIEVIS